MALLWIRLFPPTYCDSKRIINKFTKIVLECINKKVKCNIKNAKKRKIVFDKI